MRLLHLTIKFTYLIGKLSCAAIPSPETHFSDSRVSLCLGSLKVYCPRVLRISHDFEDLMQNRLLTSFAPSFSSFQTVQKFFKAKFRRGEVRNVSEQPKTLKLVENLQNYIRMTITVFPRLAYGSAMSVCYKASGCLLHIAE